METLSVKPKDWLKGAFPHFSDPDQINDVVYQALNPNQSMLSLLEKYRNYIFTGLDGKASERVAKLIKNLLKDSTQNG